MDKLLVEGLPAETRVPPCRGIVGKIFGHNFVTAINQDTAGLTPDQMARVVDLAKEGAVDMATMQHFISQAEPGTTVVKAIYCTRCGEEKSVNGNGNQGK